MRAVGYWFIFCLLIIAVSAGVSLINLSPSDCVARGVGCPVTWHADPTNTP